MRPRQSADQRLVGPRLRRRPCVAAAGRNDYLAAAAAHRRYWNADGDRPLIEVPVSFACRRALMPRAPSHPLCAAARPSASARHRMIAAGGAEPRVIVDYQTEELTHQAVAAVIASGAADVGKGVRRRRFGLDFVAPGEESYYRAVRHARADAGRLGCRRRLHRRTIRQAIAPPAEAACPSGGFFRRQPQRAVRQGG